MDIKISNKEWIKRILSSCSLNNMKSIMGMRQPPILIGGCGRSGTSLLHSILAAHPNINAIDYETEIFICPRVSRFKWVNKINHQRKILAHLLLQHHPKKAKRWCEKTPRNIRFFDMINEELNGQFRMIQIIRDGRAVISSKFPKTGKYHVSPERWVNDVERGLDVAHYPNIYTLRYEDLIDDFENTVDKLFMFLEEPITPEINNFHKHTSVKKHGAWHGGDVKPIFSSSKESWKKEENREIVNKLMSNKRAVELLNYYGYLDCK